METDIKIFESVDSTNTILEEMAEAGAKEGTCVVSFFQRAGQGRSGRSFYSPQGGNLYMSFLLRPDDKKVTELITVMAASAVVCAIKRVFDTDVGIKWVNDIFYKEKKVCGILARALHAGEPGMYVILGIGINIYEDENVPEDIRDIYGSLFGRCPLSKEEGNDRAVELAKAITDIFSGYYEGRDGSYIETYRSKSIVTGRSVSYISGDKEIEGKVADIDGSGAIVIETEEGIRTFRDGEIRIKMR